MDDAGVSNRHLTVGSYIGLLNPADNLQQVSMALIGGGQSADNVWGPADHCGWCTPGAPDHE